MSAKTNPQQMALLQQFMQQGQQNSAPLIQPEQTSTTVKGGKPITLKAVGHSFKSALDILDPGSDAYKSGGQYEDTMKDALGFDGLKRAFGPSTTYSKKAPVIQNTAPQLYWGSMIQPK